MAQWSSKSKAFLTAWGHYPFLLIGVIDYHEDLFAGETHGPLEALGKGRSGRWEDRSGHSSIALFNNSCYHLRKQAGY